MIAALIFLLMITYMPGWWVSETSLAGQALVGSHTVHFAFLPFIPHAKHLHLILSPATIFLERAGFSSFHRSPEMRTLGLLQAKTSPELRHCRRIPSECGRCTEHCPANNTGKELDPKLIALGYGLI